MSILEQKQALLSKICELALQNLPASQEKYLAFFIEKFIGSEPFENLVRKPISIHAETIAKLWQFFQQRDQDIPKFEIYMWQPAIIGDASDRLIIKILNDDMSFLVSSLTTLLDRHNIASKLLLHPIFNTKRDPQGQFIDFDNSAISDQGSLAESYMYCEIVDSVSLETVEILKTELQMVLEQVRLANRDWQLMCSQVDKAATDLDDAVQHGVKNHIPEIKNFLNWMRRDHFTFLGYCYYKLIDDDGNMLRRPMPHQPLGILKNPSIQELKVLFEGIDYSTSTRDLMMHPHPFLINKASQVSHVQRGVLMDAIGIKRYDTAGQPIGIHLFLGLFTSVAYDSSARDIPYLREKLDDVLKQTHLLPTWHNGKALIDILDSLPRDELFQATIEQLKDIGLEVLQLQQLRRLALFIRFDSFKRFLSCLVYIPEDRFNSELADKIGDILAHELQGELIHIKAQLGSLSIARVHYIVRVSPAQNIDYDFKKIEEQLIEVARSWQDDLRLKLNDYYNEWQTMRLFKNYRYAFSQGYQERFEGDDVVKDIVLCEQVYITQDAQVRVYSQSVETIPTFKLKIFNPNLPLALSDILPILENLDVRVISEMSYKIEPQNVQIVIWLHEFELTSSANCPVDLDVRGPMLIDTLQRVRTKKIEDDGFNRLVLRAGLTWREAELVRAYFRYLKQLNIPFVESTIQNALVCNPLITQQLIKLFQARFDSSSILDATLIQQQLTVLLQNVNASDDDRILRRYINLIQSTIRTNYYQITANESIQKCLAIKFDCAKLDEMPLPRPIYEIFVYSPKVEAVHLRGGKVARGGIRWSDRYDDFRTEILGLMKAQMVKNVVIIPVGSKGGFIVKSSLSAHASRDEILAEGIECYKNVMRALLDITDNLINGKVVHPQNVIRYDDDDPYLVVAADKGTASFSDYANSVSAEYNFWLGDAFASGGSAGYDHKKMAITARGAWESVKQHFRTLDINVNTDVIRVIGIGDMAGDVFGNGMLLSDKIKLVGAFNHQHIFIDPNPDTAISFKERQRLFQLSRSTWHDYDSQLISGGGVFDRSAKSVELSQSMQQLLQVTNTTLPPNEIIKLLLTLDVDLIWFGGIGTFVKSSIESHQDVGDRFNDRVRINGRDLRCRVIAEGANLGMTHLGRIEYNRFVKGRLNTDAIDNSAGVDTSDHEVNIKILLNQIVTDHQMTAPQRNDLLATMTDSIAKLVLRDNYLQNLCINYVEWEGAARLDSDIRLIRLLEKKGKLNRAIEFLPDDAKLAEYQAVQIGLSRPETAILLAYAKINLFEEILSHDLIDESWLDDTLIRYFPQQLQQLYRDAILKHPLRREITATCIVNQIINRTGPCFIYDLQEITNSSLSEVLRAFLLVVHIFDFDKLWLEVETYDFQIPLKTQLQIYNDLINILRHVITWSLRTMPFYQDVNAFTHKLADGITFFIHDLHNCLDTQAMQKLNTITTTYTGIGLMHDFAERLAVLTLAASSPDILLIADKTGLTMQKVAKIYFFISSRLQITSLRAALHNFIPTSQWSRLAINDLQDDLYECHNNLVINCIKQFIELDVTLIEDPEKVLELWTQSHHIIIDKYDCLLHEISINNVKELAVYQIIIKILKSFTKH